jgi:hypothetical protein
MVLAIRADRGGDEDIVKMPSQRTGLHLQARPSAMYARQWLARKNLQEQPRSDLILEIKARPRRGPSRSRRPQLARPFPSALCPLLFGHVIPIESACHFATTPP